MPSPVIVTAFNEVKKRFSKDSDNHLINRTVSSQSYKSHSGVSFKTITKHDMSDISQYDTIQDIFLSYNILIQWRRFYDVHTLFSPSSFDDDFDWLMMMGCLFVDSVFTFFHILCTFILIHQFIARLPKIRRLVAHFWSVAITIVIAVHVCIVSATI